MKIVIMQPGYLPWLGFFELMCNCDLFVLLDDVQYTKKDWRSRNRIRTQKGWMWLTVPVLTKGKFNQCILDVRIDNSINWQRKHLNSIVSNYSPAPFFKKYIQHLAQIYTNRWEYLIDIDLELIRFLSWELGIRTPLLRSSKLNIKTEANQRVIDICKKVGADILYDSHGALDFIEHRRFEEEKITVLFQDYSHPVYKQVFEPFVSHMSVLDLILNYGHNSLDILLGRNQLFNSCRI